MSDRDTPPVAGNHAPGEVTQLLRQLSEGNQQSLPHLMPMVYDDLRRVAGAFMRRERAGHTLQVTALVHEAYLRLVDQRVVNWQNRAHFFAIAAQAMRRILVEHARAKGAEKRGGEYEKVSLDDISVSLTPRHSELLLSLDEALSRLEQVSPRQCRIIEYRFFAGMTEDKTAAVLDISARTVKRDWRVARAWLNRELGSSC